MGSNDKPKARQIEIVVSELKDELLIYDLAIHKAYCLNQTSALVWNLCDGNNSVSDISRKLGVKLKSPISEDFVWLALNELKRENLLSESTKVDSTFNGLSRREVIRRVGLASLIAIPGIVSLAAPTAAMAQSGATSCTGFPQGTCPSSTQRCVGGTCVACVSSGNPCDIGNPGACCSLCCTAAGAPAGSFICC